MEHWNILPTLNSSTSLEYWNTWNTGTPGTLKQPGILAPAQRKGNIWNIGRSPGAIWIFYTMEL